MGSNNSQPEPSQSRPAPRQQRSQDLDKQQQLQEGTFEKQPPLIYLHEKNEELTFNFFGILDRPTRTISPSNLFYIAVCYPYYCQSVHEMIRQAIRTQSIQEAREEPDYSKNFQFSENMDYCRVKVLERCQFRHKFRTFFKDANSPSIQYIEKDDNGEIIQREEINFTRILTMLRNSWSQQNRSIITKLFTDFNELMETPTENFRKIETILPILSPLMGSDNCQAFIPHRDLIWEEIDKEFDELKKILINSKPRCCLNFSPSEPLHSVNVEGTIISHGICSNGKFLFALTKEKMLNVFLIYKGMINRLISYFKLSDNWEINENTIIFCSQKWFFIKDKNITYQVPISELVCDDKISFKVANKLELQKVVKACSNGATYSIINMNGSLIIFDADSDKIIVNNENKDLLTLLNRLPNEMPLVTNGMFIGILLEEQVLMLTTYLQNNMDVYLKDDCFPKDYNKKVKAATIDALSNVYFSVIHDGNNSKICSHPYTGAPDSYLFGLKFTNNLNNDSFESCLLKYLIPCAFSPSIPDNLITNSNPFETDLKSIVKWIEKYYNNVHLIKALILLIDINFKKYESKEVAPLLLPTLKKLLLHSEYKRLISALLINNFDLFFDEIGLTEFGLLFTILYHPPNGNGDIFNEWALNKISHSSLLSKIIMDEEYAISLFTDKWQSISRDQDPYSWFLDMLLIAQQNSFEEAAEIVEKDPLNLNESTLISSLCSYAQFLMCQFVKVIEKVIEENPNKQNRHLDYDSLLYTLIANFFASAAPITGCVQFANTITNEDARKIIRLLNDEFDFDDKLQLFIGYFDMIFTTSISSLIRGGTTYPCEDEYKWLIHGNFNNGNRDLTPPDLSQARFFLSSLNNEVIINGSKHLEFLYKNVPNFKLRNEDTSIDPFLIAAFTHQTNTYHLFTSIQENNNSNDNDNDNKKKFKVSKELNDICIWVRNMRRKYISARRLDNNNINNENANGSPTYQKQSDRFLANLGILIVLDPVLTNYLDVIPSERTRYSILLEKFIQNNEPYQFHKILKAIPTRIENVLNGFDQLNSLFQTIQNQTFHRIIIDGISRVDSFERLGYLLSHAELDERALTTLTIFNLSCISLLQDFHQISILEILYTVLQACKNFNDKAIECMNELSRYIRPKNVLFDPFFYTVAGLSASTSAIPELLGVFPPIAKACIIQLIFSKKDVPMLTVADLFSYIFDKDSMNQFSNPIWVKMLFTIFIKCEDDEHGTLYQLLKSIFSAVANLLDQRKLLFSTLPEIIYGFRAILNSGNSLTSELQKLLQNIKVDSSVGEKMLLFAIIAGDISDHSLFYAIRNRHGKWLKYSNEGEEEYCLQIPITPISERRSFEKEEITDLVQDVELDLDKSLPFETVLSYWDTCMKDQGSLLCRLYLETLTRYIVKMNNKIPEENLSSFAKSARPYIDFHVLSSTQTKIYKRFNSSFNLLPEHEHGFGVIKQAELIHLFAYNIMKLGDISINAIMLGDGFIVIHKQEPIVIQIPSGSFNTSKDPLTIENGIIQIAIDGEQSIIFINDVLFVAEENSYIEFIVSSLDKILFDMDYRNFTLSQICFDIEDNLNVEYSNNIFKEESRMDDFVDDFNSIKPVEFQLVNAEEIERTGKNICYNKIINDNCFNDKLPFDGSASMNLILSRKNEFNICNQLKSVILAQHAINNIQSLDWPTSFSLIKSSIVTVVGLNKDKLNNNQFPFNIEKGFFLSCSLNFIQSSNVQIFFNAIKSLIKIETFMNELGKSIVIMAQDRNYHSLIHKKDLLFIAPNEIKTYNNDAEKDFVIDFNDGSVGIIKMDDSGSWLIDTPIVLLLLLWIFIDNCKTSFQRVCAKLAIVDCMLIQSPMISRFMPEFLTYIQDKLVFLPDDFSPVYIHHLSTLAVQNPNNPQIINFYKSEKNCFNSKQIHRMFESKTLEFNKIPIIDFDSSNHVLTPTNLNEIIQLLRNYESVNEFPVWYFLPIWKTVSSTQYERYIPNDDDKNVCTVDQSFACVNNDLDVPLLCAISITCTKQNKDDEDEHEEENNDDDDENYDCELKVCNHGVREGGEAIKLERLQKVSFGYYVVKPKERKQFIWTCEKKANVKLQMYKVKQDIKLTHDALVRDIKSFSVDWTDSDTEELLLEITSINFKFTNFTHILLETLNMTELIHKFGINVVLCKVFCLFLFNLYLSKFSVDSIDAFTQDDDEIRRLGRENSRYFTYQNRIGQFTIKASKLCRRLAILELMLFSGAISSITLNSESAMNFMNGKSNDYCDSMIYQLSEKISKYPPSRFRRIIWRIDFKGSDAVDLTGVTNQTITMAINSFLYLKTGLCIISPNFTENTPNSITVNPNDMGDTLVIPYPSNKDDEEVINSMLFGFGVVIGSMIRCGVVQDIPFPQFIWNFLAGKSITKEDVYENDTRLRDQIVAMKDGILNDHHWNYRDWNNVVKPILGFPEDKIVSKENVDIYETVVVDLRIKSLIKFLTHIRNGLYLNQEINDPAFISGGLISFLCQGKKKIDIPEIIKRIAFENGNEQLRNNFITILSEYDQVMMKKFLVFSTAKQRPPNFSIVPDYLITVKFDDDMVVTGFPLAHTCFNEIDIPTYPTLEIMREKLNVAIQFCEGMDIK